MKKKQYIVILSFFAIGVLTAISTGKYIYYIPSSIIVGVSTALTLFNDKDKLK